MQIDNMCKNITKPALNISYAHVYTDICSQWYTIVDVIWFVQCNRQVVIDLGYIIRS